MTLKHLAFTRIIFAIVVAFCSIREFGSGNYVWGSIDLACVIVSILFARTAYLDLKKDVSQ